MEDRVAYEGGPGSIRLYRRRDGTAAVQVEKDEYDTQPLFYWELASCLLGGAAYVRTEDTWRHYHLTLKPL